MKKILSILLCIAVVWVSVTAQKRFVMLDKVVAVVGNSSISYSDVQQAAKMILEQRRSEGYTSDRSAQSEALENLMLQKLLYNQALLLEGSPLADPAEFAHAVTDLLAVAVNNCKPAEKIDK